MFSNDVLLEQGGSKALLPSALAVSASVQYEG